MMRGHSKASARGRQYADDFLGDVYRKHLLYFLKMSVIGHYGIAAAEIGGNDMGLIGEVVDGEPDPVEQAFLPGQQSGKFEIVADTLCALMRSKSFFTGGSLPASVSECLPKRYTAMTEVSRYILNGRILSPAFQDAPRCRR
jgi:hypothetical protein